MYTIEKSLVLSKARIEFAENVIDLVWPGQSNMFRKCLAMDDAAPDIAEPLYVLAMTSDFDRAVGFCMSSMLNMSDRLRTITWAVVDPKEQGKGVGRQMVQTCIDDAAERKKELVLGTMTPSFFEKMGFETIGYYEGLERHIMQYKFGS